MESVSIISDTDKKILNKQYQDWQAENPDMQIIRIHCSSVHLKTGTHPGDCEHFIFIFFEEKPPPVGPRKQIGIIPK